MLDIKTENTQQAKIMWKPSPSVTLHPLKKLLGLYALSSLCAGSLCPIIGVHIYKLFSQFKMKIKRKIRPLCHFYFGELLLLLLFSYKIHGVVLAYDYLSCPHSDSCYERS